MGTKIYRSPLAALRTPASPSPDTRMRVPSSTPAGIFTDRLRRLSARPSPPHAWHGSAITSPLPRHVGQPRSTTKKPCWARTLPAPLQVEHVCARLCPLAPLPSHESQ